ncbi:TPA: hypothetical protein VN104_000781 [Streptococcus pyogenes]|nr:hypothetical protein [Streptococcus pyogenes]
MIPKFRAFNKKTQKMYSIDGFKSSERKIYRCSLADDEFRSGRLETFHFVEDNLVEKCNRPPERFYRQKQVRKSDRRLMARQ